ncbi:hypothetical protein EDD18DRAFT_1112498 [Armillaria luteobubalina]|uniref:Uncharacterized protein n=1 Tax=Armillaria luteobubalina TaxID=153913 RepID=A0AA39UDL4_9AGAR|nr:hypothetical protein EDD18DRAFT_1112498 [Armillaria luteobubalina]
MVYAVLAPELIVSSAAVQSQIAWNVYCLDKPGISIWSHMKQKICLLWEQIRNCCCHLWKGTDQETDHSADQGAAQDTDQDADRDTDEQKLTMSQGFFLSMGGFCEEGTGKLLTLKDLRRDRSLIPELAKAMSSVIASLLWFYKPFNVQYHIELKTRSSHFDPDESPSKDIHDGIPRFSAGRDHMDTAHAKGSFSNLQNTTSLGGFYKRICGGRHSCQGDQGSSNAAVAAIGKGVGYLRRWQCQMWCRDSWGHGKGGV